VGGTGMIGSTIARHLADRGDTVTIGSRRGPQEGDPEQIAGMPRLLGDYAEGGFTAAELAPYDAVVMSAGQDIRHVRAEDESAEFWNRMQSQGVPAFAARAKDAGVARFVQIGSYYHHLHPDLAESVPYVAARKEADEGARALSDENFASITLNPPSIVGVATPRARRRFEKMAAWLRGESGVTPWAPPGGTNYMSVLSLAQATAGALDRGEGGRAYLVGDESLTFRDYFQRIVDLTGGDVHLEVHDEEHPLQPDRFIVQGRGATIAYEPDPEDVARLGYQRQDVTRALREIFGARG